MKSLISAFAALFLTFTPALANPVDGAQGHFSIGGVVDSYTIDIDYGGSVAEYIAKYNDWKKGESKVVVDGPCISACTFMLGILNDNQVCVTKRGFFAFHSASYGNGEFAEEATKLFWFMYPERVKTILRTLGWDGSGKEPHPTLLYVKGTDLYPLCKGRGDGTQAQ